MDNNNNEGTMTFDLTAAPAPIEQIAHDLAALVNDGGLTVSSLPAQAIPSLALPLVQLDRPAAAPARWWTRSEELRGYPAAQESRRKLDPGADEGWSLGVALRGALVSYRERWELSDDEGLVDARPSYENGRKRRAQVLAALPVADEVSGARWVLCTLTAGGLAASTLRAAYTNAVKARRSLLRARKQSEALAVLLPAELLAETSAPKPIPGNVKGERFTHGVVRDSGLVLSPALALAELLSDERETVEEWSAGVGWSHVQAGSADAQPDDGDDIPFGQE